MAVINPTFKELSGSAVLVKWSNVTDADTCATYWAAGYTDRSFQIDGSFGGATAVIQGTNFEEGDTNPQYVNLSDPSGTEISMTQDGIAQVLEITNGVRPSLTGGTSQDVTIYMIGRRPAA